MSKLHSYICRIELFSGLSPESLKLLDEVCLLREYGCGEHLFFEGQRGEFVFFLISGVVQLSKVSLDGKEVVIKIINPGDLFAEVILFEKGTYPVNALALADSRVLQVSKRGMVQLLEQVDFRNDFISALMRKQKYLKDRIHFLTACNVDERFKSFLLQQYGRVGDVESAISKKEMAGVLGVTPESLSRLLLRLQKEGLLQWRGRHIKISPEYWSF